MLRMTFKTWLQTWDGDIVMINQGVVGFDGADDAAALGELLSVGVLTLVDHDFLDKSRRQGTHQLIFKYFNKLAWYWNTMIKALEILLLSQKMQCYLLGILALKSSSRKCQSLTRFHEQFLISTNVSFWPRFCIHRYQSLYSLYIVTDLPHTHYRYSSRGVTWQDRPAFMGRMHIKDVYREPMWCFMNAAVDVEIMMW